MKPRYLRPDARYQDRWMVSYLDVLTILLIFFLVVAARALTPAAATPAAPIATAPEAPRELDTDRAEQLLRDRGLDPHREARGVVVSLAGVALFGPGSDVVNPGSFPTIGRVAEVLREIPNEVRLVGHADATPVHSRRFPDNQALAVARSRAILELLRTRFEIPEKRLSLAGYGDWRPTAPNDTAGGRASNRRVEFVIVGENRPDQ